MYAEMAMQYLRDAVQRGFRDAEAIRKTDAFAPLRDRADYKELMEKLKGEPAA